MYEAEYSYAPQTHREIALTKGDKITNTKDVGNGWIIGFNQTTGETGILPLTYLKPLEPSGIRRTVRRGLNSVFTRARRGGESSRERGARGGGKEGVEEKMDIPMVDPRAQKAEAPGSEDSKRGPKMTHEEKPRREKKVEGVEEEKHGGGEGPGRLALLGQQMFKSGRGEHRVLKAVLGLVFGLLLGGLVTVLLFYSYHYTWQAAGITGGVLTLLLCLGLTLSVHFRCMVALTLPGLFTARGRAALLSVIVAMMLTGPITNIAHNSQEAATSMACVAELAYNQSQALQGQLQEPVIQLRQSLERNKARLQNNFQTVQKIFQDVNGAIATVKNGVTSVSDFFNNAANQCSRSITEAMNSCNEVFTKTKRDCENTLRRIDPVQTVSRAFSGWSLGRRKRDASSLLEPAAAAFVKLNRYKRAGLMDVCKLFDVGAVCSVLETNILCKPVNVGGDIVRGLDQLTSRMDQFLRDLVDYRIVGQAGADGRSNASATRQQIVSSVRSEIQGSLDTAMLVIDVASKVLSAALLLMFLQSAMYLRNYLAKVKYDNIYISRKFKALDEAWSKAGQPAVLPLRKREAQIYVSSFSVRMSPSERRKSFLGMITVVLLMLQFAMTVLFAYVLYYVLYLIQKHGSLEFEVSGSASVMFSIEGTGFMARLARVFLSGLNVDAAYSNSLDISHCLPRPRLPDPTVIYTTIALFLVAFLCVLLQAYGLRLRHWIVAYYYPEQDEARIAYLHREILLKRKSADRETKERLTSVDQGQGEGDEVKAGLLERLASKATCCRSLCPCLQHKVYRCNNCQEAAPTVRRCQGQGCSVLLCQDCMSGDSSLCPVCSPPSQDGQ